MTFAARRAANIFVQKNPKMDAGALLKNFNYEELIKRFGKVEGFQEKKGEFRNWTFWTYAKRASEVFGDQGSPILKQLKRHRRLIKKRAADEILRAVARQRSDALDL